jgi:hypothetical protein
MTSTALLGAYRTVRDLVDELHQHATAVDAHLSRFQIYGSEEEIGEAIAETESLFVTLERLERELRSCVSMSRRFRNSDNRPHLTSPPEPIAAEL